MRLLLRFSSWGGGVDKFGFWGSHGLTKDSVKKVSWFDIETLTAINLAGEGLEAFSAVRDVNRIKFPDDSLNCWNMRPEFPAGVLCDASSLIKPGYYAVKKSFTSLWDLEFIGDGLGDLLDLSDKTREVNNHYRIKFIADAAGGFPDTVLFRPENDAVFYRMVEVKYEDGKTDMNGGVTDTNPQTIQLTSFVQWKSGGDFFDTRLFTILTNHQPLNE